MPDFDVMRGTAADEIAPRPEPADRLEPGLAWSPVTARIEAQAVGDAAQPVLTERRPSKPRPAFSPRQVIALQRAAGNRAVRGIVRPVAQRVAIKDPKMTETLYNSERKSTAKAKAGKFEMDPAYDMTRTGDTGADVTVRIQFMNQTRDSNGNYTDQPTEIPASDARRAWAKDTAEGAVKKWNGRLTLVGEGTDPVTKAKVKKRLPLTFNSVAVFGAHEPYHNRVIVYPKRIVAGSPGQPIDAGNWYMNKGKNYDGDDKLIAAHEYGHLIGIPDEYSQSNEQLNALIHQAAPANAPSAMAAIDRASVGRMVLSSIAPPLFRQLNATMSTITKAFRAQRTLVKQKMAAAAAAAVSSAVIVEELRAQLTGASTAGMAANVPDVVARDTTTKFNEVVQAGKGVEAGFSAKALADDIRGDYIGALGSIRQGSIAVAGLGDVSIDVAHSVRRTGVGSSKNAVAAGAIAKSEIGPAGLPKVIPSSSLVGQISALPETWASAGSLLETGVTPEAFTTAMLSILKSATAAAATPPPGAHARPKLANTRALEDRAFRMVSNAASGASRQVAADLVDATIGPILTVSAADLGAKISAEVDRVMTTPPAGIPALGPADPNMATVVAAMKATLDKDKAATAGTGRDPLGAGKKKKVADQNVTYSYQGLMGSSDTEALRGDQFDPMVAHFNHDLLTNGETPFTAEVK